MTGTDPIFLSAIVGSGRVERDSPNLAFKFGLLVLSEPTLSYAVHPRAKLIYGCAPMTTDQVLSTHVHPHRTCSASGAWAGFGAT